MTALDEVLVSKENDGDQRQLEESISITKKTMVNILSDELEEMLLNADEHTLDVEKLDAILAELDELEPLPKTDALDVEAGLRRLREKMDLLF